MNEYKIQQPNKSNNLFERSKTNIIEAFKIHNLSKEDLQQFYFDIKKNDNIENQNIITYLKENNNKQIQAIQDNFQPSPNFCEFNQYFKKQKFKFVEFVNIISSMYFRKRVGRNIPLVIYDINYDFIYGIIALSSPMLFNKKIDEYLKTEVKDYEFKNHTTYINNNLLDITVCVGVGELTKYLTGKMLFYCGISKEVIDLFNNKYSTDIKLIMTTSIYGKSSIYNRINKLQYLGLTEGYNSAFTEQQIKWIKETYKQIYPNRLGNKTAKTVHLFRLYEHLYDYYKGEMPFYPLKIQKGTYLYDSYKYQYNIMEDNINYWLERWYYPRKERLETSR